MPFEDGLKIEVAAGIVARDQISKFFVQFAMSVRMNRQAARAVTAAYVDGLAGAVALAIQGRHGSKRDIVETTVRQLREAIERDLKHLREI
jgi:hypothetical protein